MNKEKRFGLTSVKELSVLLIRTMLDLVKEVEIEVKCTSSDSNTGQAIQRQIFPCKCS